MITLTQFLRGTTPPNPLPDSKYYLRVPPNGWTVQGDAPDGIEEGDCGFVSVANHRDLISAVNGKPGVIPDVECAVMYRLETGWRAEAPGSDQGVILSRMVQFLADTGWAADGGQKPLAVGTCALDQIPLAIELFGAIYRWALLPQDPGGNWDFSGGAVQRGERGVRGHAMAQVAARAQPRLITWGGEVLPTQAWLDAYGQPDVYWALWPDWKLPGWATGLRPSA